MRRRVSLGCSALAIWFLSVLLLPAVAIGQGQLSFVQPAAVESAPALLPIAPEIDGFLQRGQEYEGQRRWGEALTLYEDALRQYRASMPLPAARAGSAAADQPHALRTGPALQRRQLPPFGYHDVGPRRAGPVHRSAVENPIALRRRSRLEAVGRPQHAVARRGVDRPGVRRESFVAYSAGPGRALPPRASGASSGLSGDHAARGTRRGGRSRAGRTSSLA